MAWDWGRGWDRVVPRRLRRHAVGEQVDAELAFHLEMRTQEFVERGLGPAEARAEALRRMGDLERVRGACRHLGEAREREMRRTEWLAEFAQDLRFGARQLLRARGLTAVAGLTLALGIGATAAIFGVVDAVVLRPLPFDAPERIVRLRTTSREGGTRSVSHANFLDWRAAGTAAGGEFERMGAQVRTGMTLTGRDVPLAVAGSRASADWFAVFGVRPQLGRTFVPEEEEPGRDRVVVLSARAWATYFRSDPGVVGRTLTLDGVPRTVVGVMPPAFDYVADVPELWVPLALSPAGRADRDAEYLEVAGRLRAGARVEAAQARMDAVARRLEAEYEANRGAGVRVRPMAADLVGSYRRRLLTLLGAVGFVLLIGCANVANLLLARGAARARELAVRRALGAGRVRLVRQLLTESLLLALLGGAAGAALATLGVRALVAIAPDGVPRLEQAGVDARVLLFTLALSVASSVAFGLAPALRAARPDLHDTLRAGGRGTTGAARDRLRNALVVAEVALALVLLTGAGLLTRSAVLLHRVEPGFDPAGVLAARIVLPAAGYPDGARVVDAYRRILDEAERVPGVASAGLVLMVPLGTDDASTEIAAEGRPLSPESLVPVAFRLASRGYFATLGIPLRRGRDFTDRDAAGAPRVAIVNEALARRLWPGEDPVGKRISGLTGEPSDPQWTEVIGVAADVRGDGLAHDARPEVYYAYAQAAPVVWPILQRSLVLVARAAPGAGDAASLERPLRAAVARVDPNLPLASARGMEEYLAASLATSRFTSLLLGALSGLGLVLAAVGIYGVVAYHVAQRVPEIGVRVALGATPRRVLALVVRRALRPVVLGVAIGVAASAGATRALRGLLYGVSPTDPLTVAGVVALLLGTALLASLVPARRATRVDPAAVTRG